MSEIAVEYRRDRECVNTHRPLTHSLDYGKEQAVNQHTGEIGKVCTKCNEDKPLTEYNRDKSKKDGHRNICKVCRSADGKAYRETNRDRIAASKRAYYEANREKYAANGKAWREANSEKVAAYQKAYYEANREKYAANGKAWREANRDRFDAYQKAYREANRDERAAGQKAWREANRERLLASKNAYYEANREEIAARRAEKWANDPEYRARFHAAEIRRKRLLANAKSEPYLRESIFERDGWKCGLCDEPIDPELKWPDTRSPSIDHVIPLSLGGDDTPANVQAAHLTCNVSKGNRVELDGEQAA